MQKPGDQVGSVWYHEERRIQFLHVASLSAGKHQCGRIPLGHDMAHMHVTGMGISSRETGHWSAFHPFLNLT